MELRPEFLEKWKKYLRADQWNKFGGEGFRVWGHGAFPFVVSLIPDGVKSVLELGCADGYLLFLIKEKGLDPIGLTYSDGEQKMCSERNLKAVVGDMHDIPFYDKAFDCVVSRQTMEHALSYPIVLMETNRVLKENGYVVMHVPYSIECDEENLKDNEWHYCALSPNQWKYYLSMFGFKKIIQEGREPEQCSWYVVAQKTKHLTFE